MNVNQRIFIGVFTVFVWMLALVAHHYLPDIDVSSIANLCQTVLVGLGVTHLNTSASNLPPDTLILTSSQPPKGN